MRIHTIRINRFPGLSLLLLLGFSAGLRAADGDPEDYKVRLDGAAWFGKATGNIYYNGDCIDLGRDFGLGSTISPMFLVDFKPWRKHHFFFGAALRGVSNEATLSRDITFNGQTFAVGGSVATDLRWNTYVLGYQYDIVRRRWGHIGIAAQLNVLDMKAKIAATGTVSGTGGSSTAQGTAEGSVLAPLPVLGPEVRVYVVPSRVFIDGDIKGMYFFGYGQYIQAHAGLGINFNRHVSLVGGYLLEGRTVVHGDTNRLGVKATQAGAVAGLEARF